MKPGRMLKVVLEHVVKKPATLKYPQEPHAMPKGFRGKIKFYAEKCIGCKMCMRDCPAHAITIRKIDEKKFEAEFDLGRCVYCAQCVDSCLKKALEATEEFELAQLEKGKLKVVFREGPQNPAPKGT